MTVLTAPPQNLKSSTSSLVYSPSNWKHTDTGFSRNDFIDAYLRGKEYGRKEYSKILLKQFSDNIDRAANLSEQLYRLASQKSFKLKGIHLKAYNISNFTTLFLVNKDEFLSEDFREMYKVAQEIKNESESDTFDISFSFMPVTENIDTHCLTTDGFIWKYEKK